jgi:hypothetical protein
MPGKCEGCGERGNYSRWALCSACLRLTGHDYFRLPDGRLLASWERCLAPRWRRRKEVRRS